VVPKVKQSAAFGLYVLATAFAKSLGFLITILMLAAGMALSWPFATVTLVRRADWERSPPAGRSSRLAALCLQRAESGNSA